MQPHSPLCKLVRTSYHFFQWYVNQDKWLCCPAADGSGRAQPGRRFGQPGVQYDCLPPAPDVCLPQLRTHRPVRAGLWCRTGVHWYGTSGEGIKNYRITGNFMWLRNLCILAKKGNFMWIFILCVALHGVWLSYHKYTLYNGRFQFYSHNRLNIMLA